MMKIIISAFIFTMGVGAASWAGCGPGGTCEPKPGSGLCWDKNGTHVIPCPVGPIRENNHK